MPELDQSCCGEAHISQHGIVGVLLTSGSGGIGRTTEGVAGQALHSIRMEQTALLMTTGNGPHHVAIAGRVSRVPHHTDFGAWGATVSGNDESPLYIRVTDNKATLTNVQARLHKVTLPIEDADLATLEMADHNVNIAIEVASQNTTKKGTIKAHTEKEAKGSLVVIGRDEPFALIELSNSVLTIRRSTDLLNLTFTFEGFEIRVYKGNAVLRRQRAKVPGFKWIPAKIGVEFPPQHIAEKFFPYQDPTTQDKSPGDVKKNSGRPPFSDVEFSRLSGPSRIVFCVDDDTNSSVKCCSEKPVGGPPKWDRRLISVSSLTDWSKLALAVNRRALGPETPLETQLRVPGITKLTNSECAIEQVEFTFTPPTAWETSLEMAGRLILSPATEAKWLISSPEVSTARRTSRNVETRNIPLWHARLDQKGRTTVRALWSHWLTPRQFPKEAYPAGDPLLVLCPQDHWEIVAQTSLYGLPAVRGFQPDDKPALSAEAKKHVRHNRVIRLEGYKCLEEYSQAKRDPESIGFASVEPFDDANIVLSSLGGSLVAEWNGEPFTTPDGASLPKTFTLERFLYRSQLGRDIHVEVFKKGYLLPLGIRASYVKLSERRFFPHPQYKYPVAYLVQRTFITIRNPEKRMPAVNQPNDSRDFPTRRILMMTRTTPDLVNPENDDSDQMPCGGGATQSHPVNPENATSNRLTSVVTLPSGKTVSIHRSGKLSFNGLEGLAFWPRITEGAPGTSGDVEFKWSLDDDNTPITSKLLFVDNRCSHNKDALATIVEYYRSLGRTEAQIVGSTWHPLRTARLYGTRRRYAPETQGSETAFDTDSWLLTARGCDDIGAKAESFAPTDLMNQADQPAFYPVVEKARIAAQTLDRLLGGPQGLLEVQFYGGYIDYGFDALRDATVPAKGKHNPGELFLEVIGPRISLNVTNNGAATGGLARTNSTLAALSRITGFVGDGSASKETEVILKRSDGIQAAGIGLPFVPPVALLLAVSPERQRAPGGPDRHAAGLRFEKAEEGTFDPSSFFNDKAKLLGLISFKDILNVGSLSDAPKLLEKTAFSAFDVPGLLRSFGTLATSIRNTAPQFDKLIAGQSELKSSGLTFKSLYPTLESRLKDFGDSLDKASTGKNPDFAEILGKGNEVLGELERVARDPVPQIANDKLSLLQETWREFSQLSTTLKFGPQTMALADLQKAFRNKLPELGLRLIDNKVSIDSLQENLFAPVIGSVITELLASVTVETKSVKELITHLGDVINSLAIFLEFLRVSEFCRSARGWSIVPFEPKQAAVVSFAYDVLFGLTLPHINKTQSKQTTGAGFPSQSSALSVRALFNAELRSLEANAAQIRTLGIETHNRPDLVSKLEQSQLDFDRDFKGLRSRLQELSVYLFGSEGTTNPIDGPLTLKAWVDGNSHLNISRETLVGIAGETLRRRSTILNAIRPVVQDIGRLSEIAAADKSMPPEHPVNLAAQSVANVLLLVTSIGRVGDGELSTILRQLSPFTQFKRFESRLRFVEQHVIAIRNSLTPDAPTITTNELSQKLASLRTASDLVKYAGYSIEYFSTVDRQLSALGLETIAFSIDEAFWGLLSWTIVGLKECITLSQSTYNGLATVLTKIDQTIAKSVLKVLFPSNAVANIRGLQEEFEKRSKALGAIKIDPKREYNHETLVAIQSGVDVFTEQFSSEQTRVLASRISALGDSLLNALKGDLIGLFNDQFVRPAIEGVKAELEDALRQLIPSTQNLTYDWSTTVRKFGTPSSAFEFEMINPEQKKHLSLNTKITVDFLSGKRTWQTTSRLDAFRLKLFSSAITVNFGYASFTASEKENAKVDVAFQGVELGNQLAFVKALQSLMNPDSGNGPYLTITPEAALAGFRFDAGLIQVGSLQFIHVSLNVFTRLPLKELKGEGVAAQVGFGFGSASRPFLISQPPYGGGGYVNLVFADSRLKPEFSLSFGAVAAIAFGPLKGHGRITATITWSSTRIMASVEAVGEGHLGCFGISVMIQVFAYDDTGTGHLVGGANYSFEFTVGFLSFSFSFHAEYTIAGGPGHTEEPSSASSSERASLETPYPYALVAARNNLPQSAGCKPWDDYTSALSSAAIDSSRRRVRIVYPQKSTAWDRYRERLSLELLES